MLGNSFDAVGKPVNFLLNGATFEMHLWVEQYRGCVHEKL